MQAVPLHQLLVLPAALCLAGLAPADVHTVDPIGQADFATIQEAVDAALDGDVILLSGGTHDAFTIDGKSVQIFGTLGATPLILGTLEVINLDAADFVLVAGVEILAVRPPNLPPPDAVRLVSNAGEVRFQNCRIDGGDGGFGLLQDAPGGEAVEILDSARVTFSVCTLEGGLGTPNETQCCGGPAGDGGDAVFAMNSGLVFYECDLEGGRGGSTGEQPGDGGTAVRATGGSVFASGTAFRGGRGGTGWDFIFANGSDGGDGLFLEGAMTVEILDCATVAGLAGSVDFAACCIGSPGLPVAGTVTPTLLPGTARSLRGPHVLRRHERPALTLQGEAGDVPALFVSHEPGFTPAPARSGIWLTTFPASTQSFAFQALAGTGPETVVVPGTLMLTKLGATDFGDARLTVAQALFDDGGAGRLTNPLHVFIVDCDVLTPDCNGNGEFDACELLSGGDDCNGNQVPDACEPDCNANGVADSCDIDGASLDVNLNGVPDECEGSLTIHVDAGAAPGGDGTAGAPYRSLSEGIGASLTGDTVLVYDGVYSGPLNSGIDIGAREIRIESVNGFANCTIDLAGENDHAFEINDFQTRAMHIEGLTIRNGGGTSFVFGGAIRIDDSDATIENCRFLDNTARLGGAIYVDDGSPLISNCLFVGNRAESVGSGIPEGGAIRANRGSTEIELCVFRNNFAEETGGAIRASTTNAATRILISRSAFLGNSAGVAGGAIEIPFASLNPSTSRIQVSNCLIAGNSAPTGAGIFARGAAQVSNCTLTQNAATGDGGGIAAEGSALLQVYNSTLWVNTAAVGGQLSLADTASVTVHHCDVQGGFGAVAQTGSGPLLWGGGNLDADPLFVDADGPDNDPLTLLGNDWRLAPGSPCIDAGDNAVVTRDFLDVDSDGDTAEPTSWDLNMFVRFVDDPAAPDSGAGSAPLVDIGAQERQVP